MKDMTTITWKDVLLNLGVIGGTFVLLNNSRLPSPLIVLMCLLLGWGWSFF